MKWTDEQGRTCYGVRDRVESAAPLPNDIKSNAGEQGEAIRIPIVRKPRAPRSPAIKNTEAET